MNKETVILITENNPDHLELIKQGLRHAGLHNEILLFVNHGEILDFLFVKGDGPKRKPNTEYLLILNVDSNSIDGIQILEKIKQDNELKKIPVIILTDNDEQKTIEECNNLGCSTYIVKPTEKRDFEEIVQKLGCFLSVIEITSIK